MARSRNIKPGLFDNEILGKADPFLTILFAALWCLADRKGRLEDRPEQIRKFAFGYRKEEEVNVERSLFELQRSGFIIRYKVAGKSYIQVVEFLKHQRPHVTEKESVLPACDSNSLILKEPENFNVYSTVVNVKKKLVLRSDSLIPDLLIPDSLIPDHATQKRKITVNFEFERFWQIYPKRPGANKTQALKAWIARLKDGVSAEEMIDGTINYANYCKAMEVDPRYVKQAATFIGPDKHFLMDWKPTGKQHANQSFADRLTGRSGGDDGFTFESQ
jgi:hypothetical protein